MAVTTVADKAVGYASYFIYNQTIIPITRVNVHVTRAVADCTDSSDFDTIANIVGKTQIPVSVVFEGTVEGRYRRSTTSQAIIQQLFTGITAVPCVFGLDQNTLVGTGTCDITDYTQDMTVEDVVNFSCTVRSNGLFTPN